MIKYQNGIYKEDLSINEIDELEDLAWQDKNKLVNWFLEFGEYTLVNNLIIIENNL